MGCIDNDFAAENGVRIQQRSIGGVLQRFFTENVWIFTKNTTYNQEHRQHKAEIKFL